MLVCYEARPTGFEMTRLLDEPGVACQVIAPGLVPREATDRVKTDRRDARKLARALRADSLTPIRIPARLEEAFRDLIRTRTRPEVLLFSPRTPTVLGKRRTTPEC
ncbi:MAG: hypothetical protein C7B43_04705 [Sulfobacillus benefaciens]|uniref:Transposase IS110-like N-terminal domain-containing protein n=1 Tax=Sulfobacillus benefaciens TaxID=453960 RepID=A0A2T2X8G5_9FIRM|nr:MAG: hypothetical protein C7B43_04705 [Sulfobacillus benefaciens]